MTGSIYIFLIHYKLKILIHRHRELGLFNMEKRRLQGNLIVALQYLIKGDYKKEGEGLFVWADSDRKKGNGFKLKS